jgi:3-(3-hydroxy-phenyl)propionate hydroxylase
MVRASDSGTVTVTDLTRSLNWTLLIFGGIAGASLDEAFALSAETTRRFGDSVTPYVIVADRSAQPSAGAVEQVLLDALHLAHERYGITNPAFYLFRPDTYISARGPLTERASLLAHLEAVFAGVR